MTVYQFCCPRLHDECDYSVLVLPVYVLYYYIHEYYSIQHPATLPVPYSYNDIYCLSLAITVIHPSMFPPHLHSSFVHVAGCLLTHFLTLLNAPHATVLLVV